MTTKATDIEKQIMKGEPRLANIAERQSQNATLFNAVVGAVAIAMVGLAAVLYL